MDALLQDLRYGLRTLLRNPGFTLVAVLTLALGIGANTAIFSVLYGVLLRPLPYPEPDRLAGFVQTYPGGRNEMYVTYRQFQFLEENNAVFQSFAATTSVGLNLFAGGAAERVNGLRVSRQYFRVLGVAPQLGRGFLAEEDQPGGPSVAVLSQGLWRRRFGAEPGVIGRVVSLDGVPTTIVGVMPAGFHSLPPVDVWSTLAQVGRTIGSGTNLEVVGRLKPGLTLQQAGIAIQPTTASYRETFSQTLPRNAGVELASYQRLVALDLQQPVRLVFGAIALVLLIACANVASLVLGRAAARDRELAVRVAMGASGGRLTRQLLTEGILLTLVGGAVGFLFATWGLRALLSLAPADLTSSASIQLDRWALLFTFGVSLATGLVFGLLPARQAHRTDLHDTLREGAGRSTSPQQRNRLRSLLVIGEVALSVVLLAGGALLVRTFVNLMRTETGFDPSHVLSAEIWLTGSRYTSTPTISGFYTELTRRLEALPGVERAAVVEAGLPLQRGGNIPAEVEGQFRSIDYRTVTPGYFDALRIPLLTGRVLTASDAEQGEPVMVVNRAFAHQYLTDSALGRVVKVGGGSSASLRRIVGVVGDVKSFIGYSTPPTAFITSAQTPVGLTQIFSSWFPIHVVLRTTGDPGALGTALARTIHETDPQVPVGRVRAMAEVLAASLAFQRFVMTLLALFALLAVMLAAVGLYGVMSYLVAQRTHEIGVRMALGADPGQVLRMVLGRGMVLAAGGAAVGLVGAVFATRLLANQLYGVKPADPLSLAAVTALLAAVALLACFVPARRGTRVDPVVALRTE
jgi:putative ABC transport system permease protein